MLDPKQMQAFCTLAHHMHFGQAAKSLGVSQSTLSTQIRMLEEEIGGPLINRSNRTMTLTRLGETFLADAQNILSMMECAIKNTTDILDGSASTLRLGVCTGSINAGILGKVLEATHKNFPKLDLTSVEEPPATLMAELTAGHLDIVICNTFSLDLPKQIVSIPVTNWRATLIARKDYDLLLSDGKLDVSAVSKLPFFLFEHETISPHIVEHIFLFKPKFIKRLPSVRLIVEYVEQGLGAAIIPDVDSVMLDKNTACYPIPNAVMPVRAMRSVHSNSPMMIQFFHLLDCLFRNPAT